MTTAPLFISQRGIVACPQHGGNYLAEAYERDPQRFTYRTPLDHWERLSMIDHGFACHQCGATTTRECYPPPTVDPEYADIDTTGQLALGVPGQQRQIAGLATPRKED